MTVTRTRSLSLALVLAATALSCARRHPESTLNGARLPTVASSVPPAEPPAPASGFRLVAEFEYPIGLAPVGSDALLVAGDLEPVPLALVGGAVDFRPQLARLNDPTTPLYLFSAAGGTWPGDAWLALAHESAAGGPSSSDLYQWNENEGWIKRYEYGAAVIDIAPWRGNVVLLGSHFNTPVMLPLELHELSSSGLKSLSTAACSENGGDLLAPSWVDAKALNHFGYACGSNSAFWPQGEGALVITALSSAGARTQRRFPLPDDLRVAQVVVDGDGPMALLTGERGSPRLARFANGRWNTVADLPPKFERLSSPGTHSLWGVVGDQLRTWQGPGWTTTTLPSDARYAQASWHSVWRRGPDDVWLIGKIRGSNPSGGQWLLFNSAGARATGSVPSDAARAALAEGMTHDRKGCTEPFANFIQLHSFEPASESQPPDLSDEAARSRLSTVLKGHPELRHLKFVSHDCHGALCIGAQVKDRAEVEALRALLPRDTYARDDDARCVPPPISRPFAVPL